MPPAAPRLVTATAGLVAGHIHLGWTLVSATPKVLGHQVRYQRQPAQPGVADWSVIEYVDQARLGHPGPSYSHFQDVEDYPLHPGHRYRYQVRARNAIGYGPWSEPYPVNGVIASADPPGLDGLVLDDESVGLVATWSCPNHGFCAPAPPVWPVAVLRLTTQYKSDSSSWSSLGSSPVAVGDNQVRTTHRVSGLSRGLVHAFRSRVVNANGIAGGGSSSGALVPLRTQTALGTDAVSLSWAAPTGYSRLVWQYRYKETASATWNSWQGLSTPGTTAQTVSGLTAGVNYQFQVQALSGGLAQVVSFIESATVGAVVPLPSASVSLGSDSYQAIEGDEGVSIAVVLSQAQPQAVAVPVTVTAVGSTHADDYTVTDLTDAGTVSFAAGTGPQIQWFTITANGDADTLDETVRVSLGTPPTGLSLGPPWQATVTLLDNDDPPNPLGEEPVVSGGSVTCYVGEYCSYTFPLARQGTAPITYRVSPPSWATASGRSVSGTAPSSPGTFSASLSASNAYGTDSAIVTIRVERRPVNPVAPVVSGGSITCYVGEYCSYTFLPAREGTAPITYRVSPPSWATASGRSVSGTAPSSPGTYSASLSASNAYGTDSAIVTINVVRRGVAPVLPSVSSITCYVGEYCSYTFPAATSGTAPITYRVSPPSWASTSGSRGFAGTAPSSPGTQADGLVDGEIYALAVDGQGQVWAGHRYGKGLSHFDGQRWTRPWRLLRWLTLPTRVDTFWRPPPKGEALDAPRFLANPRFCLRRLQ